MSTRRPCVWSTLLLKVQAFSFLVHAIHVQSRSTIDGHHMTLASVFPPGEPGDRVQFSEFILANVRLYALRHDKSLSTHAVANFTRTELATALRKVPGVLLVSPCMLHPARHMPLPAWGVHAAA